MKLLKKPLLIIFLLAFSTFALFIFVLFDKESSKLMTVTMLNIGQGDAIFIEAPNGTKVIVDGGPDKKILSELGGAMPFYEKKIDMLVVTNPDKDHLAGFLPLLDRYQVDYEIESGTHSKTEIYQALSRKLNEKGIQKIIAHRGQEYILDEKNNVKLTILYPDKDVSELSSNDGSIVAKLTYASTSIMFQGDATAKVEDHLLSINEGELDSDILKVGHHGSRTSTIKDYVKAVTPAAALISDGVDNSYGHPHKETLETLNSLQVPILRTDILGRITLISDGEKWTRKDAVGQKLINFFR